MNQYFVLSQFHTMRWNNRNSRNMDHTYSKIVSVFFITTIWYIYWARISAGFFQNCLEYLFGLAHFSVRRLWKAWRIWYWFSQVKSPKGFRYYAFELWLHCWKARKIQEQKFYIISSFSIVGCCPDVQTRMILLLHVLLKNISKPLLL